MRRRRQRRRRRDEEEAMATSLARGVFPFPSRTRQRSGGDVGSTKVRRKLGGDNGLLLRPSPQAAALPPGEQGKRKRDQ